MNSIVLIGAGVIIIILLIVGLIVSINSERSLVEERLGRFLDEDEAQRGAGEEASRSIVTEWMNRRVASSSMGDRVARELARADLKFKVIEYYALVFISTLALAVVAFVIQRQIPSIVIGGVVGFFLPRLYVKRQQAVRLMKFNDQLGDMLNLMVNGLRAGYSTMQAMEAVSKELPPPICDEFRRVVREMQLGIPMEHSLENLVRRIPSEDLDLTITAMNVQREVGGNLAEILDTISYTIRERVRIKGEIRVMTSQVVYSSRFLSAMPVLIAFVLWFLNRPYMMLFFKPDTRLIGIPVLIFGGLMILGGYFVMKKIADIDV
jgi:tight adherence protein B